ncbi:MAG TPA: phage holin family protein [Pseudonocardiaceae bacterium]|nr:phage holin family protein [Pseudonocardiaceae bacterium]
MTHPSDGDGQAGRERSVGELVHDATEQIRTLVQDEMRLARAELGQKGKRFGVAAGSFGDACVFAFLSRSVLAAVAGHAAEVAKENADTVASTARQVGDQVRQQVDQLPEPVREQGQRVFRVLRQRPALVVVAVIVVLAVVRMAGRRGR